MEEGFKPMELYNYCREKSFYFGAEDINSNFAFLNS